jgi:hypothetical protein
MTCGTWAGAWRHLFTMQICSFVGSEQLTSFDCWMELAG